MNILRRTTIKFAIIAAVMLLAGVFTVVLERV